MALEVSFFAVASLASLTAARVACMRYTGLARAVCKGEKVGAVKELRFVNDHRRPVSEVHLCERVDADN